MADIVKLLGNKKAADIYGISAIFIKEGGSVLAQIIAILFNKSINEGIFPSPLKNAKVIPIHKSDSNLETKNYRPISLFPIFSKMLENLCITELLTSLKSIIFCLTANLDFKKTCLLN